MILAKNRNPQQTLLNVDQFLLRYDDGDRQKLIDGEIIDLEPTGIHEEVAAFLTNKRGHSLHWSPQATDFNHLYLGG